MKKKLNTDAVANELRQGSVFFRKDQPTKSSTENDNAEPQHHNTTVPRNHGTTQPRNHDTTVSRNQDDFVETIRKAVKEFGKEAATYRFTAEEKRRLADIVYFYKQPPRKIKTSENELTRIGINFLLEDYKQNEGNSILAQVIKKLNE